MGSIGHSLLTWREFTHHSKQNKDKKKNKMSDLTSNSKRQNSKEVEKWLGKESILIRKLDE